MTKAILSQMKKMTASVIVLVMLFQVVTTNGLAAGIVESPPRPNDAVTGRTPRNCTL